MKKVDTKSVIDVQIRHWTSVVVLNSLPIASLSFLSYSSPPREKRTTGKARTC